MHDQFRFSLVRSDANLTLSQIFIDLFNCTYEVRVFVSKIVSLPLLNLCISDRCQKSSLLAHLPVFWASFPHILTGRVSVSLVWSSEGDRYRAALATSNVTKRLCHFYCTCNSRVLRAVGASFNGVRRPRQIRGPKIRANVPPKGPCWRHRVCHLGAIVVAWAARWRLAVGRI